MPGYKGHLAGGVFVYTCTLFFISQVYMPCTAMALGLLCVTCAGALFPDIDIKSKGQKYFYWILLTVILWSIWRFRELESSDRFNAVALLAVSSCFPMLVRHRGITHEPLFIFSCAIAGWFLFGSLYPHCSQDLFFYTLFFAIGGLSHIWLDKGLIKKKKYRR